jgi:hypothetical protein
MMLQRHKHPVEKQDEKPVKMVRPEPAEENPVETVATPVKKAGRPKKN